MTIKKTFVVSLASVFIFLVAIVFRSSHWKTIRSVSGQHTDDLRETLAFLESRGIRCRLLAEEAGDDSAGDFLKPFGLELQVHEEDLQDAARALSRYEHSRFTGSGIAP
ncbi:hypothetical protein [Paenibacillus humicola]|uniref:hypothetical protein n=1 Tax=Paenibacillus humicola TaxID=3110540 RepID=UPI00237B3E45|nr:hypothetical protein [Paenibacillus humicola]